MFQISRTEVEPGPLEREREFCFSMFLKGFIELKSNKPNPSLKSVNFKISFPEEREKPLQSMF